jgi:TonB family protein
MFDMWSLVLHVGLVLGAAASPEGAGIAAACPPPAPATVAQPPDLQRTYGKGGLVVLLLELDACGRVLAARVERSSLRRELDEAAVSAAASWVLDPVELAGGRAARLPVTFDGFPRARDWALAAPDPCLDARQDGRIDAPGFDPQFPGYLEDPCGLGYASIQAALDHVRSVAFYSAETASRHAFYAVRDANGPARWYFSMVGAAHHPTAFKLSIVNDGEREYFLSAHGCEMDVESCVRFLEELKASAEQPPTRERSYLSSFLSTDSIPY